MSSDKRRNIKRVFELYKLFHEGKIPTLAQHEVNPNHPKGSRENYLYFTLPVSINFQRSSPAMWSSALKKPMRNENLISLKRTLQLSMG